MIIPTVKHLLQNVTLLRRKYDEISRITGEQFNVFEILNISTQEVRMHSSLLGELLNRHGTHGCGSVFLDCFLAALKKTHANSLDFLNRIDCFNVEESTTSIEYHIGYKNEAATEGGRIDILIEDNTPLKKCIIIENKIYAGDQFNQLLRYNNFNKEAPILYLTLNGDKPSDSSKGDLVENNNFICISYKENIINWLEICLKEATGIPLLRETIKQYINLLKILTNQTTHNKMSLEIKEQILKDKDAFQSAKTIAEEYSKAVVEIEAMVEVKLYFLMENIISWHDYQIRFRVVYDGGWIFGFSASKNNSYAVNRAKDLMPIVNILKQMDSNYKNSDYYLGYKNCYNPFTHRSFVYLDGLDVFDLYDTNNRDVFISKIHQKANEEIDLFIKKVSELKHVHADTISA